MNNTNYILNDTERGKLAESIIKFLQIRQEAIHILNKHKDYVENADNTDLKTMLPSLVLALDIFEKGKARIIKDGIEGMCVRLQHSIRGDRPGLGLSRGLGDFIFEWEDRGFKKEWSREIMDAANAIENYYNNMITPYGVYQVKPLYQDRVSPSRHEIGIMLKKEGGDEVLLCKTASKEVLELKISDTSQTLGEGISQALHDKCKQALNKKETKIMLTYWEKVELCHFILCEGSGRL